MTEETKCKCTCEECGDECNPYYKRLEQENKELKVVKEQLKKWNDENLKRQDDMQLWIDLAEEQRKKYRSALEEIRNLVKGRKVADEARLKSILDKIEEVLNEN